MAEKLPSLEMEEIQQISVGLRKSATNLFSLLANLLEWSRMQRGLTIFTPTSFLLPPKISESILLASEAASAKDITVNFDVPSNLSVFADGNMFASILRYLITNAVKFTPRWGNICILAKSVAYNTIQISVKDRGVGMNQNLKDNLFRLDGNTGHKGTDGEPSTGLGLIICKDLIDKHEGKIWVDSVEGKGSAFYFTIPH